MTRSMRWVIGGAALALAMAVAMPLAAQACSNLGPDKHVGVVQAVDRKAGTFTIVDAETKMAMAFQAKPKTLTGLKVGDRLVVRFTVNGKRMSAEEVRRSI